jgi:hypothetical protein
MTSTEETLSKARNIINQIGDLWAEKMPDERWVAMRQATNDELDVWVAEFFRALVAERDEAQGKLAQVQPTIDAHMQQVAHRVMDVFEKADEDALAEEIMQEVFTAIGLVESFTGNPILAQPDDEAKAEVWPNDSTDDNGIDDGLGY